MTVWFNRDRHFDTRIFIRYVDLPFAKVEKMTADQICRWNERHLGDLPFETDEGEGIFGAYTVSLNHISPVLLTALGSRLQRLSVSFDRAKKAALPPEERALGCTFGGRAI
jgi:hypothetical protein